MSIFINWLRATKQLGTVVVLSLASGTLLTYFIGMMACSPTASGERTDRQQNINRSTRALKHLTVIKHEETGYCFAVMSLSNAGYLAHIPCKSPVDKRAQLDELQKRNKKLSLALGKSNQSCAHNLAGVDDVLVTVKKLLKKQIKEPNLSLLIDALRTDGKVAQLKAEMGL